MHCFGGCNKQRRDAKMSANKKLDVNDSCKRFQQILHHWLRFVGLILGQDIFNENFAVHFYTLVVLAFTCSIELVLWWTMYHFRGEELGNNANVFSALAVKVSCIQSDFDFWFFNKFI